MGEKIVKHQLKYLIYTKMPRDMTAKEWIRRARAINSLIPHMAMGAQGLTDEELRDEVIEPNLPSYLQHKMELLTYQTDNLNDMGDKLSTLIADHEQQKSYERR